MSDVNPMKMMIAQKAANEKMSFLRKYTMSNGGQWTVIAAPNYEWAKKVFPDAKFSEVVDKLWDAILAASRVREDNDPVQEWTEHMERLAAHNKKLNEYNFQKLNFKNDLGTDLEVKLVENHIWGGGGEIAQNGVYFAPNIPTEETFSMPHKDGVNGKVVSTKPLNYSGKLIEGFWLEFKDGKVVKYHADKEEDALKSLLELDEGSSRLGEVALISHDSPISNTNILFYNTLFDENASCHLALGNAYTMNIKDGHKLSEEELIKKGYNKSMTHVDFMFGSADMKVIGTTQDGKEVTVFEKGNFVF
jgi:aminopeptidase